MRVDPAGAADVSVDRAVEDLNAHLRARGYDDEFGLEVLRAALAAGLVERSLRVAREGRRDEAVANSREAVAVLRRLAEADHAAYDDALVEALGLLDNRISEIDRFDPERPEVFAEIVAIRRRQARADPAAREVELAMSLNILAVTLECAGRLAECPEPVGEAVAILRRAVAAGSRDHEPRLALMLGNAADYFRKLGELGPAWQFATEAVEMRRRLAPDDPGERGPMYAGMLAELASAQVGAESGGTDRAMAAAEEAAEVYGCLAAQMPGYEAGLAAALRTLARVQAAVGRTRDALETYDDVVDLAEPAARAARSLRDQVFLAGTLREAVSLARRDPGVLGRPPLPAAVEPIRPEARSAPGEFDRLFSLGSEYVRPDGVSATVTELWELSLALPTGRVVVCDPYLRLPGGAEPLAAVVGPTDAAVVVSVAVVTRRLGGRVTTERRVAGVKVGVSDAGVAVWEPVFDRTGARMSVGDELAGQGVDSGVRCILDASRAQDFGPFDGTGTDALLRAFARGVGTAAATTLPTATGEAGLIAVRSGWGDGWGATGRPVWAGRDADGRIAALVLDFTW